MKPLFLAAALAATLPTTPLFAQMMIEDAYARASSPLAQSGAAFMTIMNMGETDDRLIAASTPAAQRTELHTHIQDDAGVMRMVEIEDGFAIPAGDSIALARGGMHVMLMGLTEPLDQGAEIEITFTFESGLEITETIVIDNERQPSHGGHGDHSGQGDHGTHGDHSGHGSDS